LLQLLFSEDVLFTGARARQLVSYMRSQK